MTSQPASPSKLTTRRLFGDTAIYGLGTFLPRCIGLLTLPILSRLLGPAEYGLVDLLGIASSFAMIVIGLEMSLTISRRWSGSGADEQRAMAGTAWITAVGLGLILLTPAVAVVLTYDLHVGGQRLRSAVIVLWFAAAITSAIAYHVQNLFRYDMHPTRFAISVIASSMASGVIAVGIAVHGMPQAEAILLAALVGNLVVIGISVPLRTRLLPFTFSFRQAGIMVSYSGPLVLSGICVAGGQQIDRLLVGHLLGIEEMGIYTMAARLASILSMATVAVQLAILPLLFSALSESGSAKFTARTAVLFAAVAGSTALAITLFADPLIVILGGAAYERASVPLGWLCVGSIMNGLTVFVPGLYVANQTWRICLIYAGSCLVNIALTTTLVPSLGFSGAACANAIAATFVFLAMAVAGSHSFKVPLPKVVLLLMGLIVGFVLVLSAGFPMGMLTRIYALVAAVGVLALLARHGLMKLSI